MEWWEIGLIVLFGAVPVVALLILFYMDFKLQEKVYRYGDYVIKEIGNLAARRRRRH